MNPQQGRSSLDYLNEIAPAMPKRQRFFVGPKLIIFVGIVLVIIVLIIAGIANSIGGGKKQPWEQLAVKLNATETIASDSTRSIKNSQLRSINSDLKLFTTNTKRDINAPLATISIDPKKLSTGLVEKEAASGIKDRLEIGRLNAKFDSTYAREMSYQVTGILTLLQRLYASSGNPDNKKFLKTTYDNLLPTQKALLNFSASNE